MHQLRAFLPIIAWIVILTGLIVRKRRGQWRRPHTFKWAMILMSIAIVLSATAAVLQLYGM